MFSRSDDSPTAEDRPHFRRPEYDTVASDWVNATCYASSPDSREWYPPVMVGAPTLGHMIVGSSAHYVKKAKELLEVLSADDYSDYMRRFYAEGLRRYGDQWQYADIVTVVLGLADRLRPRSYLEIGVRRGRSVCAVAQNVPECEISMFDMWIHNYAGMENPGPEFVSGELAKVGHRGTVEFVDGDSHETLPGYLAENPEKMFELVTVDGDHSEGGAAQDLYDILPRLAVGGAVVFDDICHPDLSGLRQVWTQMVVADGRFSTWSYEDVGYGIGFAIRKW